MNLLFFSGQGSQTIGMGRGIFGKFPEAVDMVSSILGYSIEELCCTDDSGRINSTLFSQPAVFVTNALRTMELQQEKDTSEYVFCGHNALFASGAFDLETATRIVLVRAQAMSRVTGGSMLAVIGIDAGVLESLISGLGIMDVFLANYNSLEQTVISGSEKSIRRLVVLLPKLGAHKVVQLNTSGPFHTPLMHAAAVDFEKSITGYRLKNLSGSMISSFDGKYFSGSDYPSSRLVQQITAPVNWVELCRTATTRGFLDFVEFPGGVLEKISISNGLVAKMPKGVLHVE